uniref:NAD dependent epimerase/dehydratase n=1 Tax=Schmidtea mediterranea TaxID=79327 RepID=A0A5P8I4L8_SCHMD|nr:hypothetical protein [Schmidtea mediterranea]
MNHRKNEILVIGAGQMRTGTFSLKFALEKLYNRPCYHMAEILNHHKDHVKLWISVFDSGKMNEKTAGKIFSDYSATVDFPSAAVYKDLMEIYPNAKVVLTTRNSDDWVKSVKSTTLRNNMKTSFVHKILFYFNLGTEFPVMLDKMYLKAYKEPFDALRTDDELLKQCYEEFNEEVRKYVPKERLLEFNAKEGWEPLCRFLNLPVPNEPYPFVNTTKDFQRNVRGMMLKSVIRSGLVLSLTIGCLSLIIKHIYDKYF